MKTVTFKNLPSGSEVCGALYDDPSHVYGLGDVLSVELSNGRVIDVGWDEDFPDEPFRIVVFTDYFGDRTVDFRVRDIAQVASEVERLAQQQAQPYVVDSPVETLGDRPKPEVPSLTLCTTK